MKLACNWLPETERLVREGRIDIDFFKFPALGSHMDILNDAQAFEALAGRVTALRPILLHGIYPDMDRLLRLTKSPGISFHPGSEDEPMDHEGIADTVQRLRERYRSLDFIAVENMPNLRFGRLIQPEVIAEIVERAGCEFLLDISHAYCAAHCLGEDFRSYIFRLPLDRVSEIHINGWVEKGDGRMCHVKTNEAGYQILGELLQKCSPRMITIEYGREDDRLGVGIPVIEPGRQNEQAMDEIEEQVKRIRSYV